MVPTLGLPPFELHPICWSDSTSIRFSLAILVDAQMMRKPLTVAELTVADLHGLQTYMGCIANTSPHPLLQRSHEIVSVIFADIYTSAITPLSTLPTLPTPGTPGSDRIAKVRPLVKLICSAAYKLGRDVAVDEAMIKFQGRSALKQYPHSSSISPTNQ